MQVPSTRSACAAVSTHGPGHPAALAFVAACCLACVGTLVAVLAPHRGLAHWVSHAPRTVRPRPSPALTHGSSYGAAVRGPARGPALSARRDLPTGAQHAAPAPASLGSAAARPLRLPVRLLLGLMVAGALVATVVRGLGGRRPGRLPTVPPPRSRAPSAWAMMAATGARPFDAARDYYQDLGVDKAASTAEIRKAHRRVALKYHPDVNKAPDAAATFSAANEAYKVLSDPETRAQYDAARARPRGAYGSGYRGARATGTDFAEEWVRRQRRSDADAMDTGGDSWGAVFSDLLSELGDEASKVGEAAKGPGTLRDKVARGAGRLAEDFVDFAEKATPAGLDEDWYEELLRSLGDPSPASGARAAGAAGPAAGGRYNARSGAGPGAGAKGRATGPARPAGDYYDALGVRPEAGLDEIKKAFRARAREWHPDVNADPQAREKYRRAQEAYKTLSDPAKRQQYDMRAAAGAGAGSARGPRAGTASGRYKRPAARRDPFEEASLDAELEALKKSMRNRQ